MFSDAKNHAITMKVLPKILTRRRSMKIKRKCPCCKKGRTIGELNEFQGSFFFPTL